MPNNVKVTYFELTALGEPIRFLLSYGNQKFEDFRVERPKWPALKPTTPFGQMPVYEEDGKVFHQSLAVCRFLAKRYNLLGNDEWENLEIDQVADTINDLRLKIGLYHYEENAKIKESKKGPLFNEILPLFLERLDKIAENNSGHLACKKLTWVDFYFAALLGYLNTMAGVDITEGRPNLTIVRDTIYNIPAIKAWIATHPQK